MGDFPIWLKLVIWLVVGATVAYAVGAAIYTAMMGKYRRLSTSSNRYFRATRVVESRTPFTGTIWSHAKITSMGSFLILFSPFPVRLVLYAILEALALQAIVVTIIDDDHRYFKKMVRLNAFTSGS